MREKILTFYSSTNAFGRYMGMILEQAEPGNVRYTMDITDDLLATPTFAHGGSLSGLMDGILGVTALTEVADEGKMVATIEFKINYLEPAKKGTKVIGTGKLVHKGSRVLVAEGRIEDEEGNIIALASGTFRAYDIQKTPYYEKILATEV